MSQQLVLDIGTTSVRATLVDEEGRLGETLYRPTPPDRRPAGVVEFDPIALADAVLEVAGAALAHAGSVGAIGIANQRASTVLWDAESGEPLGPGLGWQDLRTVGRCLMLRSEGLRLVPSQSATKLDYLLTTYGGRREGVLFGTLDSWIAWKLSGGSLHVTDASNAAVTGLIRRDGSGWDEGVLAALDIDPACLPRITPSSEVLGAASALPGAPPIAALIGDQQASLVGQGCVTPGCAKVTFGTGGMLDLCIGRERPAFSHLGAAGTFPIIAWREPNGDRWGIEAILLAAGTCVEWLRDGLGLISDVNLSDALAGSVRDSGGVTFVPAFGGLGTPTWDFGARGALLGLDQTTSAAQIVHAVLDGVAHAGADLLEAAEADGDCSIDVVHLDGGMSANETFVQLFADAINRPVLVADVREATTRGAAFLVGRATGTYRDLEEAASLARTRATVTPRRQSDRARWLAARARAEGAVPFLSSLEF